MRKDEQSNANQETGRLDFIGRNIRAYRRRAGITIRDLSDRIGIRAGPLGNIERGRHAPSARVLLAVARELKISTDALLTSAAGAHEVLSGSIRPRPFLIEKPEETPLSARAERMAVAVIEAILALEDLAGAPKQARIPLCTPVEATAEGMERHARTVRGFLGIGDGVIFDYLELFESAGFRVVVAPIPRGTRGTPPSFTWYDPANHNAFFFLSARLGVERTLFQLVCGLGRVYLATAQMQGLTLPALSDALDATHAARRFAAVFLMPETAVRTTTRQLGLTDGSWTWEMLLRIKHRFGVSAESFLYRLEELDLITPARRNEIKERIYAHYEKTGWKEPDASRRVLTPNGRLGDLLLAAERRGSEELPALKEALKGVLKNAGMVG